MIIKPKPHIKNIGRRLKANSFGDCVIFELDSKILKYREVTAAIVFAAVFSTFCLSLSGFLKIKIIVFFVLLAVFCLLKLWYFPKALKVTSLSVKNGHIICRKGVFFSREYIYPNLEVVYIQRLKLPIATAFRLEWAVLRGSGNSLLLPPLTANQVEMLILRVTQNE